MSFYKGKRVFITGGSSGIGRATAVEMARLGAHVVVAGRNRERLDQAVADMTVAGTEDDQVLGAVAMDVADHEAVVAGAAEALALLGGIDVLVCNSGFAKLGWMHELPWEDMERMARVNYLGHVDVVRAFLPTMLEQGSGHISLVTSMLALFGMYGYAPYSGTKAAIVGFAEGLRHEVGPRGISVTVYYPAETDTPGLERENRQKPPAVRKMEVENFFYRLFTADEVGADLAKSIPRGRFENVLGWQNWVIWKTSRILPRIGRMIADSDRRTAEAKVEKEKPSADSSSSPK